MSSHPLSWEVAVAQERGTGPACRGQCTQPPLVRTLLIFLVVISRGGGRALPHAITYAAPGQGHPSPSCALLVALAGPHLGALFFSSRISASWRHLALAECGLRLCHPVPTRQACEMDWRASVQLTEAPTFPAKAQANMVSEFGERGPAQPPA